MRFTLARVAAALAAPTSTHDTVTAALYGWSLQMAGLAGMFIGLMLGEDWTFMSGGAQ